MSSMYILLITVLGLVGVFFNLRMLFTSYRNKTKHQNIWTLVICQFVYHVSVLFMNTVDAWTRLHVQQEEYCSAIYLLISTFMIFCVAGNLMAVLTVDSRNPVAYQSRVLFPTCEFFTTATLALGFALSVFLRWYACFSEQFAFHAMVLSVIIAVTFVVLLLLAHRSCVQYNITPTTPLTMPKTSLLSRLKKNKGIVLFVALFLMCIVISVKELVSPQAFHAPCYLLITNAAVGIALPLTVNDLVNSNSELESDMKMIVTS